MLGLFRDILVAVSCKVEMGRAFFCESLRSNRLWQNDLAQYRFRGDQRDWTSIRDILNMYL